jgi:hypothetical protein
MRWYPDLPGPRRQQVLGDLTVVGAVLLFAVLGWLVRDAVLTLTAISTGFTDSANSVQDSWTSFGDTLSRVPLVGDDLQDTVDGLADATVGNAAQAGESVTSAVTTSANTLGLLTFAVPTGLLLWLWVPRRLDRARRWTAAVTALSPAAPDDVVAMRALCLLPLADLVRFTPRPFESYRAGDYAPLVRALYEHEGVRRQGG